MLDNGLPLLVKQTSIEKNRPAEYKGAINTFHTLFFTLPPDDEFIKYNIEQAMYYIDDSGLTEYNNLKEKGYYNSIIGSSAVLSIKTDSIAINMESRTFRYYGTQRIERKTTVLFRELITEGRFQDIPRTNRNSFGVLIKDWKTILNRDIKLEEKRDF